MASLHRHLRLAPAAGPSQSVESSEVARSALPLEPHVRVLRPSGPQARCRPRSPKQWPIIALAVRVPRLYTTRVRSDLVERGAHALTVEHGPLASLIRAEVPQARLIDYGAWLGDFTGGACQVSMEPARYAPIDSEEDPDPPPGPWAA